MPTDQREIFLTFDDGPVPGPTEFVLETLAQYQAKATFFCIGDNIRKHPDIFEKVIAGGHAVGNHTFNHLKGWSTKTDVYLDNLRRCDEQIAAHTKYSSPFFRPPYGRITSPQIRKIRSSHRIIMWDVLTYDYSKSVTPAVCLRRSIRATRPGSIIVFHDSLKASPNMMPTLPAYLDHFSSLGYRFKALEP